MNGDVTRNQIAVDRHSGGRSLFSILLNGQPTLQGIRITGAQTGYEELVGREWGWEHDTLRTKDGMTFAGVHDADGRCSTGPGGKLIRVNLVSKRGGPRALRCQYRRFLHLAGGEPFSAGVRLPPPRSMVERVFLVAMVTGLPAGIAWMVWRLWHKTVGMPGAVSQIDWIVFGVAAGVIVFFGLLFLFVLWADRRPGIAVRTVLVDECGLELVMREGGRSRHEWPEVGRLRRRSMHHATLELDGHGRVSVPFDTRFALLRELMAERWRPGLEPRVGTDRIRKSWMTMLRMVACGVLCYIGFLWAITHPVLAPQFQQLGQLPVGMAVFCVGGPLLMGATIIRGAYRTRAAMALLRGMPRPWLAQNASS